MYDLIEYGLNYSKTTGSLWLYSKNEPINFNINTGKTDNLNSFKYKAKLLGNTVSQPAPNQINEILKNAAITVPLKYLSNFWRSIQMPLIEK